MREESYFFLRKISYWLIFLIFIYYTPILVFYSLGYKFDQSSRKFSKTGALSVKTWPSGATVTFNNVKMADQTPFVFRNLLPKKYPVLLEREGFYPYQLTVDVKPSRVSDFDIVLLPQRKNIEKLKFDFNVHRFFFNRHIFGEKIILFTDQGIYLLDTDFKNIRKISSQDLGPGIVNNLLNLRLWDNRLIFWNKENIWMVEIPESQGPEENPVVPVYQAVEAIKDVFLGFKNRYLVIHDGLKIVAVDIKNPSAFFPVAEVTSAKSEIFYDSRSEALYVKDKVSETGTFPFVKDDFSLFKIELSSIVEQTNENREPKKNP